jgi:hypothetical protein
MPEMRVKFIPISVAFILSGVVFDATAVGAMGKYDCGEWFTSALARYWLGGYLSGLNAANLYPGKDPLDKLNSSDQMILWMDNYCKANPLRSVGEGANALYLELARTKKAP